MTVVNDVHSKLNETTVDEVVSVDSLDSISVALDRARAAGRPVSIAGGRHAMGGQQFCTGGVVLDTRPLGGVISIDESRGLVEVEAGIQWPTLVDALARTPVGRSARSRPAPTDLSIGGAISANVHGRGLAYRPFIDDVESLVLVGPDGVARTCSRTENAELFRLVCGGYGLFGVVRSATLRLDRRRKVERGRVARARERARRALRRTDRRRLPVRRLPVRDRPGGDRLPARAASAPATDPSPDDTPLGADQQALRPRTGAASSTWRTTTRPSPYDVYATHYLATSGQVYLSDRHQLATYVDGYHWDGSSEMISELYVPRPLLADFLLGGRARPARTRGGRRLRHRPPDRARRPERSRVGA